MTSPILLIAGREFRTYVATLSFWLSLAVVPFAMCAVLLFSGGHPSPSIISIQGGDPQLIRSARLALQEAGRLEGRLIDFGNGGSRLIMTRRGVAALEVHFSDDFPLSPIGRAMVGHMIERDAVRDGVSVPFVVHEKISAVARASDVATLSRLLAMIMLWLTLTGSLGMLLQAVVRERANKALESLLAAAQAWEILAGKLLGVGAVSLLVLASWLGSACVYSVFLPPDAGVVGAVLAKFADPLVLMRDMLIYVCAFAFYGAATLALGAVARDSAAAQNLARPVFVLLLVVFFVALAGKSAGLRWLAWLPPFTPFLLLVNSPGDVAFKSQIALMGILLLAAFSMLMIAARLLSVVPAAHQSFVSTRTKPQPLV